jgi:hypothetical protein
VEGENPGPGEEFPRSGKHPFSDELGVNFTSYANPTIPVGVHQVELNRTKSNGGKNIDSKEMHLERHISSMLADFEVLSVDDLELNQEIHKMIKRDSEVLFDPDDNVLLENKDRVRELIKTLSRTETGRVKVKLPKMGLKKPLSKNTRMGKAQMRKLTEMFDRDPEYHNKYKESFETWIKQEIIVEVAESQLENVEFWIEMPHHGVNSSGKFRVVINGSAREAGCASSGEFLDPGPNLLPKISAMITKLMQLPHFVVADIEKAFLQIVLDTPDDFLFIIRWVEKDATGEWVQKLYRFVRLPWGISSAPFILNAVIRCLYDEYIDLDMRDCPHTEVDALRELHQTTYADDILIVGENAELVIKTAQNML